MLVHWKSETVHAVGSRPSRCRVALLVAADSDASKPEASVVARLASIEERYLTVPISHLREFHRGLFWSRIERRLNQLGLTPETRAAVEAQLAACIPRPGDEWALWGVTCIPHFDCEEKNE